ncbi:IS91 family transposase, partial [Pseudomonadota bacterium]
IFAPNSKYRALVTPSKRGKGNKVKTPQEAQDQTPAEKRASMTWAKRLKRVFNIDIETCCECGGDVRIIASIEDPAVIQKILAHLDDNATSAVTALLPDCRASPNPPMGLFT